MKDLLIAFATKINAYFKDLYAKIGDTTSLTTTDKTLVGAINEVKTANATGLSYGTQQTLDQTQQDNVLKALGVKEEDFKQTFLDEL